ncbi:MAG: DUF3344 domain-containing protein [Methanoregula sp.]|uniref:DUF3344 domain-containing protein n=1 Tax=Methanoregula sp. TaxID=2052170 RepID=UPI0025FF7F36|nr:DUF3344 domain-containing protein [Methanoregula sp.]MCK9632411.1 DUF3344 domain-containing protein [Methanoregula sp.]
MKKPVGRSICIAAALVLATSLVLFPIASANEYMGGIPLRTVSSGVVSGGLWYDSYPGFPHSSAYKSFSLPPHTTIEWARLYVGVYCGHMQNNYEGKATISLDTNGDGTGDFLLANEELNVPYSYPGNGGTGPVYLAHGNRVTSDYVFAYDIKNQLSGNTVGVSVKTEKVDPSFDDRIKFIALVVAYNDDDGDKIYYWVNEGHDPMSALNDNGYTGETEFGTSQIVASEDREFTATLSSLYMASVDGTYTFNGDELIGNGAPQGEYFGTVDWEVTDSIDLEDDSTLKYERAGGYFKLPLALLTVAFRERPEGTLEITSNPAGAQILLDDEETGKTTNQTFPGISIGEHTVQVILVDNDKYREPDPVTVNVRNKETTIVNITIPQINGSIDITSDPDGAWIYLDGKNMSAQSDSLLEGVIIGDHTIDLVKPGFSNATATVSLEEDQTESVDLILEAAGGNTSVLNDNSTEAVGYSGKSLSMHTHGSAHGSLDLRDSGGYSGLLGKGMSATYPLTLNLTPNASVKEARLYVYTTWSYNADTLAGTPASLTVDMNGEQLTKDQTYSDRKGSGTYDYPVETHCYLPDGIVTGNPDLSFTITNTGETPDKFAVYGVTLLVVSEDPDGQDIEYWIGEGSDAVYANPEFNVDTENAVTRITFPGALNMTSISQGELYAISTAASGNDNRVMFNGREWQNPLSGGSSGISIARLNVSTDVLRSGNSAGIGSIGRETKGDYMENRNLILVVKKAIEGGFAVNSSSTVRGGEADVEEDTSDPTSTVNQTNTALLATGPIEEVLNQSGKTYAVRVLSNPPGALVSVDYQYRGKATPDTVTGLTAGNHTLSVDMPGFDPVEERIFLTTNQTITFDLATRGTSVLSLEKVADTEKEFLDQEKYGGVYVTSSPDQAIIYVDGKKTGFTTPGIIYGLKEGKHTVQVKLSTTASANQEKIKFPIEKKEVWVANGIITPVSITSYENPVLARPVINSTAFNSSVFTINGNSHQYHMAESIPVQSSQNYVTLHANDSYITYTIFADNSSENVIEPRRYTLNNVWVESDPPGADIYVDGFSTGLTTPYLVRNLSDMDHLIRVSKPGYYPLESTVHITGVDLVRRFVLDPYLNGMLSIASTPSGGKIYINGKDTGKKTPYVFQYMTAGEYTIKVVQNQTKATYEGFMVQPNMVNEVNLTLKKK